MLQHDVDNQELEVSFKNLYLDEDASGAAAASISGAAAASISGAATSGSTSVASAGT